MANKILDLFQSSTAFTITIASLASSAVGVGRQSDMIDNSSGREQLARIWCKIKQGTSPTSARTVSLYLLTGDAHGTPHRTDGAGASDAGITLLNAPIIGVMRNKGSGAATGDLVYGEFLIRIAAPSWGIALVHDTGVNLDSTGGNHWLRYSYVSPEVQ